jgi:hypothetical protein
VAQLPPEQPAQPDDEPEPEDVEESPPPFPLLLKLHADIFLFTFSVLHPGHFTVSPAKTIHSNSLSHFMHVYSKIGIKTPP